jgi:4-diphosphocytidyl-2-C-methyl-D-erythritol kinase
MPARRVTGVELKAHAKLTRSLRVVGVRQDGYHLLDAEMVALDLHDTLEVSEGHNLLEAENLVSRALALAGRDAQVTLDKRIPVGAGLGGGSADAAAVLRWAGWGPADAAASVVIGADVPFCLMGGRARVTGVGEVVEPLPFQPLTFTLLTPPLHVATPAVYEMWDRLGGPRNAVGPNDLEPAAIALEPELARWRDRLGDATGQEPVLAGSGGTWFVEGAFEGDGLVVVHAVPAAASAVPETRNSRP